MSEKTDHGNWVPATLMKTLWSMTAVLVTITILLFSFIKPPVAGIIGAVSSLVVLCFAMASPITRLIRTKTLGAGGDCCDFHVVKP